MKRLFILGTLLLWLGYISASAFLSVLAGPATASSPSVLFTSAITLAIVTSSLTSWQLMANPADPATDTGRLFYRRLAWVFVGTLAISILITIVASMLRQSPPWVPAALAALTIVCSLGPVLAAERYRRQRAGARATATDWRIGADDRRRTLRRVGITLAVATAVALGLLATLVGTSIVDYLSPPEIGAFSLGIGAFAAIAPAAFAIWRLSTSINLIFVSDIESRTAVTKAVLRGTPTALSNEQLAMAAEFAHVWREFMPIQFAQSALLVVGLTLFCAPWAISGHAPIWSSIVFALLWLGLIASVIVGRRQYGRVRRYAGSHPLSTVGN